MASRLAVLALLLVCVVWGAWLNYAATALVEGEVNKFSYFFFRLFLRQTTSVNRLISCVFSCEDLLYSYFSYYIFKTTLRGRNLS